MHLLSYSADISAAYPAAQLQHLRYCSCICYPTLTSQIYLLHTLLPYSSISDISAAYPAALLQHLRYCSCICYPTLASQIYLLHTLLLYSSISDIAPMHLPPYSSISDISAASPVASMISPLHQVLPFTCISLMSYGCCFVCCLSLIKYTPAYSCSPILHFSYIYLWHHLLHNSCI
jgi:hypothetical protein